MSLKAAGGSEIGKADFDFERGAGMNRRKQKCGRIKRCLVMMLVSVLTVCIGLLLTVKLAVEPNIEDVSRLRAEVLVSRTVNRALTDQFQREDNPETLFVVTRDKEGKIELVQADSIAINILLTKLATNLQKAFKNMEKEPLEVPAGAFLGSKFLSQAGPSVKLQIVPLSVLSTDFKTEFESQGINQTKYKIYIVIGCRVKVLAPFSSKTFDTSSTVLIAETVILGDVPDSFVQVPEEDILDVT